MTQPMSGRTTHVWVLGCLLAAWGMGTSAMAQTGAAAQLQCEVGYAGATQTVVAHPVVDPYPVASVDIGGRFRFKAVMVGTGQQVAYIKLYSYFVAPQQPVLIHLATYLPPFTAPPTTPTQHDPRGTNLTGMQYLYAGPAERELQYQCFLQRAQP